MNSLLFRDLKFRKTWDIIEAAEKGLLPDKIMLNTHPQRWDDRFGPWVKKLVWQNVKNVVKRIMIRRLAQISKNRKYYDGWLGKDSGI